MSNTIVPADVVVRPRPVTPPTGRPAVWRWIALAPFAGAALGAFSRWWMRLLSDDPEFSWGGTIAIVLAFTFLGIGHTIAATARRRGLRRRWSTMARVIGAVLTLPIFVGAGGMMLPTVAGASLARWRSDWRRWARWLMVALAVPVPAGLVVEAVREGLTLRRVLGLLFLAGTYALVVTTSGWVMAPVRDGWRMPRWLRVAAVVAGVALLLLMVTFAVGIATAE